MPSLTAEQTSRMPNSEAEVSEIHRELERILESSWFRTSRRSCALLRYVVEESLHGKSDTLKERMIAVHAFNRSPDYDNNADPIVRAAAGDVRRRLAQYDGEIDHINNIRIGLPVGSYVPSFYFPGREESSGQESNVTSSELIPSESLTPSRARLVESGALPSASILRSWLVRHWKWVVITSALVLSAAYIGLQITAHIRTSREGFNAFWAPVISAPNRALISTGERKAPQLQFQPNGERNRISSPWSIRSGEGVPNGFAVSVFSNSVGASRVAGVLGAKGKPFDVQSESTTNFVDLSNRPVILLGAFDNDWTIRTTDTMRFSFEVDFVNKVQWIADRRNPQQKIGLVSYSDGYPETFEDYAILSRSMDSTTSQQVIVIAGISSVGTFGAVEFATDPSYLNEFARHAPQGWEHKNIEFIIATKKVGGVVGHPRIVTYELW